MNEPNCTTCKHMIIERHEDYMGSPCWYMGECEYGNKKHNNCPCYEQGEPKRKDCRIEGDW